MTARRIEYAPKAVAAAVDQCRETAQSEGRQVAHGTSRHPQPVIDDEYGPEASPFGRRPTGNCPSTSRVAGQLRARIRLRATRRRRARPHRRNTAHRSAPDIVMSDFEVESTT